MFGNWLTLILQHQLGRKVTEADQRPVYQAETFPPGTAPASNSYTPNTVSESGSQANNPNVLRGHGKEAVYTAPGDTLRGATSKDVHAGLGKPLQGQTNKEIEHEGARARKKEDDGLERVGAYKPDRTVERKFPDQRGIEKEESRGGTRGDKADRAAENMHPEPAQTLDTEWNYEPGTKRNK